MKKYHDPERLTDEQVNQIRRFRGLPQLDPKEMMQWRGYLRWMKGRFAPRPNRDTQPQS